MKLSVLGSITDLLEMMGSGQRNLIFDLCQKIAGANSEIYFAELKKFLRREACWSSTPSGCLKPVITGPLLIPATKGDKFLAGADDVFDSISESFAWCTEMAPEPHEEIHVLVSETVCGCALIDVFGRNPDDRICLTQEQIIEFAKLYRHWLAIGKNAVFPFAYGNFHFAAFARRTSEDRLILSLADNLSHIWLSENDRIIVPDRRNIY